MTNYSIYTVSFSFILISYAALFLAAQQVENLQASQNSPINNITTNTTELLYNMSQHARDLIDEGNYKEALQTLNETLTIDPNFTDAMDKGVTLYYLGQYDEAIKMYDRAIGIDPNHTYDALNNKGIALSELGRYDEAIGNDK